jgi:hypothetical protein
VNFPNAAHSLGSVSTADGVEPQSSVKARNFHRVRTPLQGNYAPNVRLADTCGAKAARCDGQSVMRSN